LVGRLKRTRESGKHWTAGHARRTVHYVTFIHEIITEMHGITQLYFITNVVSGKNVHN